VNRELVGQRHHAGPQELDPTKPRDPWFIEVWCEMAYIDRLLRRLWPEVERYSDEYLLYPIGARVVILRSAWQRRMPPPHLPKGLVASLRKSRREIIARKAGCATDPLQTEAGLLDHTLRYIDAVLEYYTFRAANPATYLAEPIIEFWRNRHVRVALDTKVRDRHRRRVPPLTLAVGVLLRRSGIKYRAQTVSDMLRERQHRKRSGKARGRTLRKNAPALRVT
jgi:hypothetical protein